MEDVKNCYNCKYISFLEDNGVVRLYYCKKNQWAPPGNLEECCVDWEPIETHVNETGIFDEEEIYEHCTVYVWRNSVTGEVSIGWKKEIENKGNGKLS